MAFDGPQQDDVKQRFAAQAERNIPRYTSYPTALAFNDGVGEAQARMWAASVGADQTISVYVHIPFCDQLCWYCGCHTTVPNGYKRITSYLADLHREIDLWAAAMGPHAGAAHLHFGGGSPNSLSPADFVALTKHLREALRVRPDAEVAVELDPRALNDAFMAALQEAGVNRASLGVQTFDPLVQAKVNRIQPFEMIDWAVKALRAAGVEGVNFDLMYGLPAQTPESVAESARLAAGLRPDRISVFGYAHVPWFKKQQSLIKDEDLAGFDGRWDQADAADAVLVEAGYERIGLDHYALPDDALTVAMHEGRLRRNFQGYTPDPADVLVPLGASAIGNFHEGYVQNARATDVWRNAIAEGRLPVERGVAITEDDRLRANVIERVMCDLTVDFGEICHANGWSVGTLDAALPQLRELEAQGLCTVEGRRVTTLPHARRLVRAVAAAFDGRMAPTEGRHSRAV